MSEPAADPETGPVSAARPRAKRVRLLYLTNSVVYFLSHRIRVAHAAVRDGYDVHVAAPADADPQPIIDAGMTYHPYKLDRGGMRPLAELVTMREIARVYREVAPDLVHHYTIKPVLYGGVLAEWIKLPAAVYAITGLGHVFYIDTPAMKAVRFFVEQGYRLAFRRPNTRVVLQNPDDYAYLISRGIADRRRTALIRSSGVDTTEFSFSPEPVGRPLVILAGRLIWSKGIGEFVEAARTLQKEGVDARFALVGATDPTNPGSIADADLQRWIDEGVIEWWGYRTDMAEVVRQSNVVCLPSYREGVPKFLIEAAAVGRAIVTTDIPGCREAVRNGENGVLVAPQSGKDLARGLRELLVDPELRARMGKRGREIAVSEFSVEGVVRRTLELYTDVLADSSAPKSQ